MVGEGVIVKEDMVEEVIVDKVLVEGEDENDLDDFEKLDYSLENSQK